MLNWGKGTKRKITHGFLCPHRQQPSIYSRSSSKRESNEEIRHYLLFDKGKLTIYQVHCDSRAPGVLVQYCQLDNSLEEVKSCSRFLKVVEPRKADANCLVECLWKGLQAIGISDILDSEAILTVEGKTVLVGIGTDGASVSIYQIKMVWGVYSNVIIHGYFVCGVLHTSTVSNWHVRILCVVPCLKTLMKCCWNSIIFMRNPPKNVVSSQILLTTYIKEVYQFPEGGNLPVRAQGSCWISHKRNALQRVLVLTLTTWCHQV